MEAHESPRGSRLVGLERPLGVVSDRERNAVLAQSIEDLGSEPAGMPELDRVQAVGKRVEPPVQTLLVAMKVLRELPENGAQLARLAEGLEGSVEALDPLSQIGETLDVGQQRRLGSRPGYRRPRQSSYIQPEHPTRSAFIGGEVPPRAAWPPV
jgi:hypothetical protein